jgi:uncharacterized membrane protein
MSEYGDPTPRGVVLGSQSGMMKRGADGKEKAFYVGAAFTTFVCVMVLALILTAIALSKNVASNPTSALDEDNQQTVTGCLGTVLALSIASIITCIVLAVLGRDQLRRALATDSQQYQRLRRVYQ